MCPGGGCVPHPPASAGGRSPMAPIRAGQRGGGAGGEDDVLAVLTLAAIVEGICRAVLTGPPGGVPPLMPLTSRTSACSLIGPLTPGNSHLRHVNAGHSLAYERGLTH